MHHGRCIGLKPALRDPGSSPGAAASRSNRDKPAFQPLACPFFWEILFPKNSKKVLILPFPARMERIFSKINSDGYQLHRNCTVFATPMV
jgi:hypothetical protein